MREIKFRYVWGRPHAYAGIYRPDDPKIVFTFATIKQLENDDGEGCIYPDNKFPIGNVKHNFSILKDRNEYTGLKDKNDKEIYEGDILLADSSEKTPYISEVIWDSPMFKRKNKDGEWAIDGKGTKWKVIGNIYENPELLEKSEKP